MHAVILAAGDGGRLYPLTHATPKPLLKVGRRPLISHILDALFAGGVREATIVVGYHGDQIRDALDHERPCGMTLRFVENAAYDEGNARSLWSARDAVREPFLLAMGDHLIEPDLVRTVLATHNGASALAVEHTHAADARADEATRAHVQDGVVIDLGKGIELWNALDTGMFWCTPDVIGAMTTAALRDGELGAVFASLARDGRLEAIDVTGMRWMDIDTPEDLDAAQSWGTALV